MKASYYRYPLQFKVPSGTSRGILTEKETWFLVIESDGKTGIGECGILRGLSYDDVPDYEQKLRWVCDNIQLGEEVLWESLRDFPSIQFGVEMAFRSLAAQDPFILFRSEFTAGTKSIPINGLVWMGDEAFMKAQIEEKIAAGFRCIKLKIGAIDFNKELDLLRFIRSNFTAEQMEIRVDANGAFSLDSALYKINQLSEFKLHSIEQPIAKNNTDSMAALCKNSDLPIALDEELIGVTARSEKENLLRAIMPQYIILKPSFIGGFRGTNEWIALARKYGIGWWITSALESNIGLNAIAQWTYTLRNPMPQGLGTGALYTNNFDGPLAVRSGALWFDHNVPQQFNLA
ncbi:o-succinylbenzoate synthase [Flavobacterium magnum]|uniref:O-succinylbenzoate synthase n=1 Tax=Flavobacterium magnum TaxID=2162713 RepID=A0A2S0RG81_9FLAO|nr:o-succinylbenzoate synthase [Flavobacterium magnum]AWA30539.1 o-succinylbenzoate synthase [Flavobacterium magnum]